MLSLRCARWVAGLLVLPVVVACSNGTGSVKEPAAPPAQGAESSFTLGGSVSGLAGSGLVLQNNGIGDLPITADGTFQFPARFATGTAYSVAVVTHPTAPAQTCSVAKGSGSIASANVADVAITCATNTSNSFTVGGTVSGLTGTGLVLRLNGNELPIVSDGSFTFETPLPSGTVYRVRVEDPPVNPDQVCTITGADGTVGSANVNNVRVNCAVSTFSVAGTVIGLMGSGLVLQNNGGDDVTVTANGDFRFPTELASGAGYNVTVRTPPSAPNQACSVTNPRGTIGNADVGNVVVSCSTADFSIGGSVRNLEGSGLVLRNNGGDDLTIDSSGTFRFDTALPTGARYDVTIAEPPRNPDQTCTVSNRSGSVGSADVTSIIVDCETRNFSVGGRVTRLRGLGGVVIQNNGGDDLRLGADGRFTFPTRLPGGAPYSVSIRQQPLFDRCEVRHGSGTIRDRDIDNVEIRCDR